MSLRHIVDSWHERTARIKRERQEEAAASKARRGELLSGARSYIGSKVGKLADKSSGLLGTADIDMPEPVKIDQETAAALRQLRSQKQAVATPARAPQPQAPRVTSPRSVVAAQDVGPPKSLRQQGAAPMEDHAVDPTMGFNVPPPKKATEPTYTDDDVVNPFQHADKTQMLIDKLVDMGEVEQAESIARSYSNLLRHGFDSLETKYKIELAPRVQQMQRVLVSHNGKKLPKEIRVEAMKLSETESAVRERLTAYGVGLLTNPMTRQLGIDLFSQSEVLAPGLRVTDGGFNAENGMIELLDEGGQIAKLPNGELAQWPAQDALALYDKYFGAQAQKLHNVPEGAVAINERGEQVFRNPKREAQSGADRAASLGELRQRAKEARDIIEHTLIPRNSMGELMEGVTAEDRHRVAQMAAKAEQLVIGGMPSAQAAKTVLEEDRRELAMEAAGSGNQATTPTGITDVGDLIYERAMK